MGGLLTMPTTGPLTVQPGPEGIEYSSIMVASHEIALIVAAYQKGIRDFDVEKAYTAMNRTGAGEAAPKPHRPPYPGSGSAATRPPAKPPV